MPLRPDGLGNPFIDWPLLTQGKVRDVHLVPDHDDLLAQVVTDCLSVYDVVLGFKVRNKGAILNTLNIHVKELLEEDGIVKTDLVAWGTGLRDYLPQELHDNLDVLTRMTIVKRLDPIKIECVVRGYLWGSAIKDYDAEAGILHGQFVGKGLKPGDKFATPVFDPTTKAGPGEHDAPLDREKVQRQYPGLMEKAIEVYLYLAEWRREQGFIYVDTKFEFAWVNGEWYLVDEAGTLDSSRDWLESDYEKYAAGLINKLTELSKQYARDEAEKLGIKALAEAEKWDDAQKVMFSPGQIASVEMVYRWVFQRLTGEQFEQYWYSHGIDLERPGKILVITGSTSDDPQTESGIALLETDGQLAAHIVCSCHGAPDEEMYIASLIANKEYGEIRAIIAGAGLSAHLPGILKAFLSARGAGHIPLLAVGFENFNPDPEEREGGNLAAKYSNEYIPGKPLELGADGYAYYGADGFLRACECVLLDDFLPKPMRKREAIVRFPDGTERKISHNEAVCGLAKLYDHLEDQIR